MKWETVNLGDVCEFIRGPFGGSLKKRDFVNLGYAVYEQQHAIKDQCNLFRYFINEDKFNEMKRFAVQSGDLLMSCSGTIGKTTIVPTDAPRGIINQALLKISPSKIIQVNFLKYYMESVVFKAQLMETVDGAAIQNVASVKILKKIKIHLPPLQQQRQIVERLDRAFEEIDKAKAAAEANAKNAVALFQSYLTEIFESNESSKIYKLDDVVSRLTNGYVGATKNIYLDSGIPYLLARHVKNNILNFDERTFISDEFNQKNRKSILKTDDVLLVQSGHIGHSAVVPSEHEGHNCHAMIVITTIKEILSGRFLSLYFQSNKMKNLFEKMRTGSTIKHLNCGDVKLLMVPIPSIKKQNNIISEAKNIGTLVSSIEDKMLEKSTQLEHLRKSVLNRALKGELVGE